VDFGGQMRGKADGFSYVEVLLAVFLIAVCIVPAMDALTASVAIPEAARQGANALLCVRSQMEKVMAEPYSNLSAAAAPALAPSATYSLPEDAACPARDVSIARYDPDGTPQFVATETGLLYIAVSSPGAGSTSSKPMLTLTTLVAR
jgi:Tfp pilus assembly protein PilV